MHVILTACLINYQTLWINLHAKIQTSGLGIYAALCNSHHEKTRAAGVGVGNLLEPCIVEREVNLFISTHHAGEPFRYDVFPSTHNNSTTTRCFWSWLHWRHRCDGRHHRFDRDRADSSTTETLDAICPTIRLYASFSGRSEEAGYSCFPSLPSQACQPASAPRSSNPKNCRAVWDHAARLPFDVYS